MSVIYGYINLSSKPVDRNILSSMKQALDFWGPDGEGLWIEGNCGIGNLLYYNTPEALFEKMPFTDASGNLILSAGARIDNREELYTIFNIPLGQRLTMPDSVLMMKAFERWGEACADHLVGDWAMAVWDKKNQKLFLARDHHGISALYYYKGEDFFVFSSSLKGILCLPQVPKKVNEYKIAQLLVHWNEGGPTTCYLDIMRLPPAHTLTLSNAKITTNRYWYLEHTPEVRLKNDQEYADMFLHLYTEAVRHRLRSHRPVGATLSSGLDSGSVCILAAKELAKEGKRLKAYTAVPLYDVPAPPGRIGNEGPYALALAEKLGNVDVTLCNAENVGVLEGIRKKMEVHDQPEFSAQNAFWIVDILQNVKQNKLGSLLIGQSGNATVSWPLASILSNNQLKEYLRILKNIIIRKSGLWKRGIIFEESFIKQFHLKDHLKNKLYPLTIKSIKNTRIQMLMPGSNYIGFIWHETGVFYKMEPRDPTIDLLLMKFLFGLPKEFLFNRILFKNCFESFFNESLLNGNFKGIQSADINKRYEYENEIKSAALLQNYGNIKIDDVSVRSFLRNYQMNLFDNSRPQT